MIYKEGQEPPDQKPSVMSKAPQPNNLNKVNSKTATPAPVGNAKAPANQPRLQQTNPVTTLQPTDTYIPTFLTDLVPELNSYEQLVEAEKKLDIYLSRKQMDIYQSVTQWNNSKNGNGIFSHYNKDDIKYLRIFISNTSENQTWQIEQQYDKEEEAKAKAKLENGNESETNESEDKKTEQTNETANANATTPDPFWTMRIEGRLIDDLPAEDPSRPKFSSFIKDIAVDFRKIHNASNTTTTNNTDNEGDDNMNDANNLNMALSGNDNINSNNSDSYGQIVDVVEWHADDDNPVEFDGLDIRRNGSENLQCSITIQPKGFTGNSLEYSKELAMIIGKSRGSLHDAVYSLYKYLLINNLLINDSTSQGNNGNGSDNDNKNGEKTIVQIDKFLSVLLPNHDEKKDKEGDINMDDDNEDEEGNEKAKENEIKQTMKLSEFLPLVNSHIKPLKPIVVNYIVRVDKASTYGELVFDVEVPDLSTLQKKQRIDELGQDGLNLVSELENFTKDHKNQLDTYEKEISLLQLQLNATANKYQFFQKLGENPVPALEDYIASQSNAMKILSGDEGFNEDTVRRSQFYQDNENMLFENIGVMLANGRI